MSDENSEFVIQKQGWLYKRGELVPNWKRRWFILANEQHLAYFVSPKPRFPKGVIPLQGSKIIQDADKTTGKNYSFIISTVVGRDYWIYSDSRSQTQEWIQILQSTLSVSLSSSQTIQSVEVFKKKLANIPEKERKRIMKENWERKSATLTQKMISSLNCQVFGENLATVCSRDGHDIPIVLQKVFDFLETKGLETEGLFRIPGSKDEIDHIKSVFDSGGIVDFERRDVHTVSGVLKQYLRDLPEPLVCFSLYDQCIATERYLDNDQTKIEMLRQLVGQLPKENRRVLYKLVRFLQEVSTKSDINNMTTSNLAIVFAPNIFVAPGNDIFQPMRDAPYTLSLTKRFIENSSYIFKSIPATEEDSTIEFEEVELDQEGLLAEGVTNKVSGTVHGHHYRASVRKPLKKFNEQELAQPRKQTDPEQTNIIDQVPAVHSSFGSSPPLLEKSTLSNSLQIDRDEILKTNNSEIGLYPQTSSPQLSTHATKSPDLQSSPRLFEVSTSPKTPTQPTEYSSPTLKKQSPTTLLAEVDHFLQSALSESPSLASKIKPRTVVPNRAGVRALQNPANITVTSSSNSPKNLREISKSDTIGTIENFSRPRSNSSGSSLEIPPTQSSGGSLIAKPIHSGWTTVRSPQTHKKVNISPTRGFSIFSLPQSNSADSSTQDSTSQDPLNTSPNSSSTWREGHHPPTLLEEVNCFLQQTERDGRHRFYIEDFGFSAYGVLNITVTHFQPAKIEKLLSESQKVGFLVRRTETESVTYFDEANDVCLLTETLDENDHVFILNSSSYNSFEYIVKEGQEGFYNTYFVNCVEDSSLDTVSFHLKLVQYNYCNGDQKCYLSAGYLPLPLMYGFMFLLYGVVVLIWIFHFMKGKKVLTIHYLMALLLALKMLTLLFEGIHYHFLNTTGHPGGWSVAYLIFAVCKTITMFVLIALIGTGWSFVKPFLSDKDKKIFLIVIPLQVLDNIAMIIIEETAPGSQGWFTWKDIFRLVDIICCGAILVPIIWSIKHLRDASTIDGKAALNLEKLKLFRHFYLLVVSYIYFTRIIVYLLSATLTYEYVWLSELFTEFATLAFFCITGYKFRPADNNPYFTLPEEDEEYGNKMEEVSYKSKELRSKPPQD